VKHVFFALAGLLLCSASALADPAGDLDSARSKLASESAYRVTFVDESGTTTIDYAPPDRMRVHTPEALTLIVGGSIHTNTGSGWVQAGVNSTVYAVIAQIQDESLLQVMSGDQVSGPAVVDVEGTTMNRYEVKSLNGDTVVYHRTIWVDAKSGLPYRVVRSTGDTTLTATYSDFGRDFGIVDPATPQPMGNY
jgi:outer membrane lipoprotein-sorting protein